MLIDGSQEWVRSLLFSTNYCSIAVLTRSVGTCVPQRPPTSLQTQENGITGCFVLLFCSQHNTHLYVHVHGDVRVHANVLVYVHVHVHAQVHAYVHVHVHVPFCVQVHVWVHVHVHVKVQVCLYFQVHALCMKMCTKKYRNMCIDMYCIWIFNFHVHAYTCS
jgi:hypothetical protein